jgi:hypothetical protein
MSTWKPNPFVDIGLQRDQGDRVCFKIRLLNHHPPLVWSGLASLYSLFACLDPRQAILSAFFWLQLRVSDFPTYDLRDYLPRLLPISSVLEQRAPKLRSDLVPV